MHLIINENKRAMNSCLFQMVILMSYCLVTQAQDFTLGSWKITENHIIYQTDTASVYLEGQLDSIYDFSQVRYTFKPDGTYSGKAMDGSPIQGIWSQDTGYLMIDNEKSPFEFISDSTFLLSSPFSFFDTLGNVLDATSVLKFRISDVSSPACVNTSTNTWMGNVSDFWFDENNWSLNVIPLECDHVIIPPGAIVTIPSGWNAICNTLEVQSTGRLVQELNSTLKVLCPE